MCVQLGLNKFADMTEDEFRAVYLGYRSASSPLLTCASSASLRRHPIHCDVVRRRPIHSMLDFRKLTDCKLLLC